MNMELPSTLLQEVIDKTANGLLMVDQQGVITFANQYAHTLFGYPNKALVGLSIDQLVPEQYRDNHGAHVSRFFAKGKERTMGGGNSFPALHFKQHIFYISVSLTPCSDNQHMIVTVTETTRHQQREKDLTDEKQILSQENAQLIRFTQQTTNGLCITDDLFIIQSVNPALLDMTGFDEHEIVGRSPLDFAGVETRLIEIRRVQDAVNKQAQYDGELLLYRKDLTPFWAMANIQPIRIDDDSSGYMVLFTDITERKALEYELIKSNNLQTAMLDSAPVFFVATDIYGSISLVNKFACELLNCHAIDLIGRASLLQLMTQNSKHNLIRILSQAANADDITVFSGLAEFVSDSPLKFEATFSDVSGNLHKVELTVSNVEASSESEGGLLWLGRDITAQREAETQIERNRMLLETTGEIARLGCWELDLITNSLWWSDEVYRIHELPKGTQVDVANAINYYAPEARPKISAAVEKGIAEGQSWDEQLPFITAKGNSIWVRAVGYAEYKDGQPIRLLGAFQDITDLKEKEQQALAASAAKSQFLANMSHEIRTPLNGVLGINQLLSSTELTEQQRGYVDLISTSGENLLALINDILDVAKIEAGHMSFTPSHYSVRAQLESLVETARLQVKEQGKPLRMELSVDGDDGLWVFTDQAKLGQIFANLISNAIKFTDAGKVHVTAQKRDDHLVVEVIDSGIGMSQEAQDTIFDKFTQVDSSSTRSKTGTGLGLSITKQLIDLLKGKIDVDSQPNVGSTFRLTLPLKLADDAVTAGPAPSPKHIMLVTADALIQEEWAELAAINAMNINSVSSAPELIAALKSGTPMDVVIVYSELPGMRGIELLKSLSKREDCQDKTLVFVDTEENDGTLALCKELGVEHYVTQAVGYQTIMENVGTPMDTAQSEQITHDETSQTSAIPTDPHVLLVEDNEINQLVALDMLTHLGYKVSVANHGKEALRLLSGKHDVNFVFMDCQMPEMDGFEATRQIRKIATNQSLPIVALTANALSDDAAKCLDAGMNEHVAKPFSAELLDTTIKKWLRR